MKAEDQQGKLSETTRLPRLGWRRWGEELLLRLLDRYYTAEFRRQWWTKSSQPHFEDRRIFAFEFAFTDRCGGPYLFYPGFFASEVIRDGDVLLDIGCGDGFLTRRFYAERCAAVDAMDIEPSAISKAKACNAGPNITYHLRDAFATPFPRARYDVVVWDGALGHFPEETVTHMLKKIQGVLAPGGVFIGSESLGMEGRDHLQRFMVLDDLRGVFSKCFQHVQLRQVDYRLWWSRNYPRKEAYWRCANEPARLESNKWV